MILEFKDEFKLADNAISRKRPESGETIEDAVEARSVHSESGLKGSTTYID